MDENVKKLIEEVKRLISVLPDDPDDYPDMQSFRSVQDKIKNVENIINNASNPDGWVSE